MDLSSLNAAHFHDLRMGGSAVNRQPPTAQNFAEVLQRTAPQSSTTGADNSRRAAAAIDKDSELFQLCLDLETFLVKNLLNSMRSTVQRSGLIDQGFAGKIYEDMLFDEYAKTFTRNAGFGLAEQAYLQLRGRQGG